MNNLGPLPYGLQWSDDDEERRTTIPHQEEQDILDLIIKMRSKDKATYTAIAAELNVRGYRNRWGFEFKRGSVSALYRAHTDLPQHERREGGSPIFGFKSDEEGAQQLDSKEQAVLNLIFRMREGGAPHSEIRDTLNALGCRNRRGKLFQTQNVKRLYRLTFGKKQAIVSLDI